MYFFTVYKDVILENIMIHICYSVL